jgi:hypothetical protein
MSGAGGLILRPRERGGPYAAGLIIAILLGGIPQKQMTGMMGRCFRGDDEM